MSQDRPHVIIIGGGFGGLEAAKVLGGTDVRVTLIDRRNHHLFQPLLYQVATAALNPADIAYPIRGVLRKYKNIRVLLGEATAIDPRARILELDDGGAIAYDYLIVATGATHSYFGNEEWSRFAPGLKSIEDALEIRRRIYTAYEAAERETDPERARAWLTFVVVGAGPTGVELAGALAEIGLHTLAEDFRTIDPTEVRVCLVEGVDRVLQTYPEKLSASAQWELERRGIEVITNTMVTGIDADGVTIGDQRIAAHTVLWAAGVQASPLAGSLGVDLDKAGRVPVAPDLSVPGYPEIFVVGDLAKVEQDGAEVPGVAQGAIQGGRQAGENVQRLVEGHDTLAFRYNDKGSMATIGRNAAVVDAGHLRFSGFFAWVFWWLVHIMFLIGFRNRLLVIFGWAWQYVTFQRGARLITGDHGPLPAVHEAQVPPPLAGEGRGGGRDRASG